MSLRPTYAGTTRRDRRCLPTVPPVRGWRPTRTGGPPGGVSR